jgi:hypothetical protein
VLSSSRCGCTWHASQRDEGARTYIYHRHLLRRHGLASESGRQLEAATQCLHFHIRAQGFGHMRCRWLCQSCRGFGCRCRCTPRGRRRRFFGYLTPVGSDGGQQKVSRGDGRGTSMLACAQRVATDASQATRLASFLSRPISVCHHRSSTSHSRAHARSHTHMPASRRPPSPI